MPCIDQCLLNSTFHNFDYMETRKSIDFCILEGATKTGTYYSRKLS